MKKFYIFDFDGTLVDSMPTWGKSMIEILNASDVSYPEDIINILTPLGNNGSVKYLREVLGVKFTAEEILDMYYAYNIPKYRDEIKLKDGVLNGLKRLKKQGYSLNVLTASPHVTLDACLKNNGVYDMFDNVWSCDDFNTSKSDVKIYSACAERLGCTVGEVIFVDDNINSLSTAKKAGTYAVGIYDASSDNYAEEIKKVVDEYILSFNEL